jgi:hypothetical protein
MGQQQLSVRKYLSIYIGPISSTDISSPAILDLTALTANIAIRTEGNSNAVSENWKKCVSLPIVVLFFSKYLENNRMWFFVTCVTESLVSCNNFCNFLSALTFHAVLFNLSRGSSIDFRSRV